MVVLLIFSLLSTSVMARFHSGFGRGGCGLGSMIMGRRGNQVFAATTNSISLQTFAISSGTSNCGARERIEHTMNDFIEANKIALANDIARGNGETIASLSEILQCSNTNYFGLTLQANYRHIFGEIKVNDTDRIRKSITYISNQACQL